MSVNDYHRFEEDHQMPFPKVLRLVELANRAFRCGEKACNGEYHDYAAIVTDKEACAVCWLGELDIINGQITRLVSPYGFTGIEYNGLRPTLKRGEQFIEIPE